MFEAINDWFMSLGAEYGVNPYIFGSIYVGAIPFFLATVAWMVRRKRRGETIAFQIIIAGFLAMSAYIYLIVAGRNLAWWVYAIIAALVIYSVYSLIRKVREPAPEPGGD
jgi:peptidoglycan/LPS O-acetylase OafA/YrhL